MVDGLLHLSLTVFWLLVIYFERFPVDAVMDSGPVVQTADPLCSGCSSPPSHVKSRIASSPCASCLSCLPAEISGFLVVCAGCVLVLKLWLDVLTAQPCMNVLLEWFLFVPSRHSHNPVLLACAAISLCLSSYSPARCSALCESVLTTDQPSQVQTLMRAVRCGWKKWFWVIFIVQRGDFIYVARGFQKDHMSDNINNNLCNWCREGKFTGSANIPECRYARTQSANCHEWSVSVARGVFLQTASTSAASACDRGWTSSFLRSYQKMWILTWPRGQKMVRFVEKMFASMHISFGSQMTESQQDGWQWNN